MVPVPATPTGRNFQTTRPHARRPEPSLPTCRGTIATAILGVWVAHLMFDLPVLQVDKTSVRVGSIVRGICRDLRSIVDCLGMCRSHTRLYTIRRRALSRRHIGSRCQLHLPIQPSRLPAHSRIRLRGSPRPVFQVSSLRK
jgi:hypothetical protein